MFNSNPGNRSVPPPITAGAYPVITPDSTHVGLGVGASTSKDFEGFVGDGDYIRLPNAPTGDIDYFSDAGVSQSGWPKAITDFSASHTQWLGFNLDAAADLLYVCTRGATLTNFILSSINSAGTVVNIATVTITQPNAAAAWTWGAAAVGVSGPGTCNFHRVADGSGNFRMIIASATTPSYVEEIEFTATGSLIQDTVRTIRMTSGAAGAVAGLHYKTPNGTLIGQFSHNSINTTAVNVASGIIVGVGKGSNLSSKYARLVVPYSTGAFWRSSDSLGGGYPTLWKGRIALVGYEGLSHGPVYFNQAVFNKWADDLAIAAGVAG